MNKGKYAILVTLWKMIMCDLEVHFLRLLKRLKGYGFFTFGKMKAESVDI